VKKIISIGVALALLTMAVVPGIAAAQPPGCPDISPYEYPTTFAKIPFAIIQSGLQLVSSMWPDLDEALGIGMPWVETVLGDVAGWAGGPLSWTVDMLAWGVSLVGAVVCVIEPLLGTALPAGLDLPAIFSTTACALFQPYACNITGAAYNPCTNVTCLG
jgi:hypothetical protein